jgi:4-hydroxy-3-polyprenylbenzoate decarboxylase
MRLVVAITGATGSIYGIRLLEVLRGYRDVETHLVISRPG